MQVTSVGHAGFRIDTRAGSILCDPWVNPAYFASWFPFPDNSQLDWDDPRRCRLPLRLAPAPGPFRPGEPERARQQGRRGAAARLPGAGPRATSCEKLGFHRFFETTDRSSTGSAARRRPGRHDHRAARAGRRADRRLGAGGRTTARPLLFNMNDARPTDLDVLDAAFGHVDVHMLQYSGRDLVPDGLRHAAAGQDRVRHAEAPPADGPLPPVHRRRSGPPGCSRRPARRASWIRSCATSTMSAATRRNIFPDQMVFLEQMRAHGHDRGLLMMPGSVAYVRRCAPGVADAIRCPTTTWRRSSPPARPTTSRTMHADGPGAGRREGQLGARRRRAAARAAAGPVRADHESERSDLRRDRISGGTATGIENRSSSTSRSGRCASPSPTRSSGTASRSPPELVRTVLRDDEPDWVNTHLPVDAVSGVAGRRLQRVPVHVLQVPHR